MARRYFEGVCVLRRSPKRSHVPSKCEAGSQKCCKDLANTRLDLRNAANSLQIEGTEDGTIYIYRVFFIYLFICIYTAYIYIYSIYIYIQYIYMRVYIYIYTVYIIYIAFFSEITINNWGVNPVQEWQRRLRQALKPPGFSHPLANGVRKKITSQPLAIKHSQTMSNVAMGKSSVKLWQRGFPMPWLKPKG